MRLLLIILSLSILSSCIIKPEDVPDNPWQPILPEDQDLITVVRDLYPDKLSFM